MSDTPKCDALKRTVLINNSDNTGGTLVEVVESREYEKLERELTEAKDQVSFYKAELEHAKDEIATWVEVMGEHASKEIRVKEFLINVADKNADDMEGATLEEFIKAQTRMCLAVDLLKELVGIKYDPMTGKEEKI